MSIPENNMDLLARLTHPDWRARQRAAIALGERSDIDATAELVHALRDQDTAVVRAAAEALLRRRDVAAVEPMLRALDLENGEADEVATAIEAAHAGWFVDELLDVVVNHADPHLRALAATALGYKRIDENAMAVLHAAGKDDDANVRAAAQETLAYHAKFGR
jgi:HEAT repeat protein